MIVYPLVFYFNFIVKFLYQLTFLLKATNVDSGNFNLINILKGYFMAHGDLGKVEVPGSKVGRN